MPSLSPRHLLAGKRVLRRPHPVPGREQGPGGSGDSGERQPVRSLPAGVSPAGARRAPAPPGLGGRVLTLPSHPAGFTALEGRGSPGAGACPAPLLPAAPRGAQVGAGAGGVTPGPGVMEELVPALGPGTPQGVSPLGWGTMSCWDVAAEDTSAQDTSDLSFAEVQPWCRAPGEVGFNPNKAPL